jgi:CspA family cold shock protein
MQHSTVKWFDAKKGYGFINHPDEGEDVFVHYSNITSDDDFKTLETGQSVKFEMNDGPKGLHAENVVSTDNADAAVDADPPENDAPSYEIDPAEIDPTAEVDPTAEMDSSSS